MNPESTQPHTNRLIGQTSAYLLQHAHNPVDWWPWSAEALAAAREQDKPIFLSVGYSTCYWCHVMERECFENPRIAQEMNRLFINIKVDREERPDIDQLYMTAVQVLTRHGGWPMSVFLTPELKPFYGGTYFPPDDSGGRPGLLTVMRGIESAYRKRRAEVDQTTGRLVEILGQLAYPTAPEQAMTLDEDAIDEQVRRSVADYDAEQGGFGQAPKFPRQTLLELLFTYVSTETGDREFTPGHAESDFKRRVLTMALRSLDAMDDGGIHDHLGGGFHRYSTDAEWRVPHFEIMLYDNAMLAWLYVEAYRQTERLRYARVARGICDFVLSEMTSADGAFFSALDAEVDAREGASYLWTAEQVVEVLGEKDALLFNRVYGLDLGPNFADPHHGTGTADQNVLFLPEPMESVAKAMETTIETLNERLGPMREKLKRARDQRKQPRLDDKILTGWNGLMIRALAYAGKVLDEPRYLRGAAKAAEVLLRRHRTADGGLTRIQPDEKVPAIRGFLDDYAMLIQGLLALRDATGREDWKDHAALLAIEMEKRFGDGGGGYFFTDAGADDLLVRQKVAHDSPLPSGNALAAMGMMGLGQTDAARRTIVAFAGQLHSAAEQMSAMTQATLEYIRQHGELAIEKAVAIADGASDVRPASPGRLAGDVVSAEAHRVDATTIEVRVAVAEGFHVQANDAAAGLTPTRVLAGEFADAIASIDYPPPAGGTGESGAVYAGAFVIRVHLKRPLAREAALALTCQPCDNSACLAPITIRLPVGE